MIAGRPALLRALTGPSTGHHSHPIPTPGCAACALVVTARTPRTDGGPGEGSAGAAEVPRERRNLMSNVPQGIGTHEVLLKVAADLDSQANDEEIDAAGNEETAERYATTASFYRAEAERLRAQAAEIRALVEMAKAATDAVQGVPDGDA